MSKKLQIRKIVDPPKMKDKPLHPNLPQPPALLLLVMPVKSGKSTIISNLLLNDDFYGQDFFDLPPKIISPTINNDLTSRFLKKACDVEDRYDDMIIHNFVKSQQKFGEASEMPSACICVDDCLGEKTTALDNLASRYRHSNIKLFIVSTQLFRKVSPVIRSNATNILIGKLQNAKELEKLSEEYSDMFGGDQQFRELYKQATKDKYSFLHLNLQENPAEAWVMFNDKIYPLTNEPEPETSELDVEID
tara:strand:+ start:1209 stop:1952 length:744 start_codon:yes stop_codon:yes gene_type:complete